MLLFRRKNCKFETVFTICCHLNLTAIIYKPKPVPSLFLKLKFSTVPSLLTKINFCHVLSLNPIPDHVSWSMIIVIDLNSGWNLYLFRLNTWNGRLLCHWPWSVTVWYHMYHTALNFSPLHGYFRQHVNVYMTYNRYNQLAVVSFSSSLLIKVVGIWFKFSFHN